MTNKKGVLIATFAIGALLIGFANPALAIIESTVPTTPTCAEITTSRTQALVSFCDEFSSNPTDCLRRDPLPGTSDTYQPCERNTAGTLCLPASGAAGVLCAWEQERGGCTGECATVGLQQPQAEKPPLRIVPRLQINIPTLKPFSPEDITFEGPVGDRYVVVPFIAQYIVAIYKYGISLAFIVSIVLVMVAGFRWMTAGGNAATIGQAKGMIGNTTIGLIILLGSYLILNTINPDLIKTGVLRIKYIEPQLLELVLTTNEPNEGEIQGATCAGAELDTLSDIADIKVTASDPRLVGEAKTALARAASIAKSRGYTLEIKSAHRSLDKQKEIWDGKLQSKYGGNVEEARKAICEPKCGCPHTTGKVVDVCITGLGCNIDYLEFKGRNFQLNENEQILDRIMKEAGFIRYCKEWWHYEYQSGRTQNVC